MDHTVAPSSEVVAPMGQIDDRAAALSGEVSVKVEASVAQVNDFGAEMFAQDHLLNKELERVRAHRAALAAMSDQLAVARAQGEELVAVARDMQREIDETRAMAESSRQAAEKSDGDYRATADELCEVVALISHLEERIEQVVRLEASEQQEDIERVRAHVAQYATTESLWLSSELARARANFERTTQLQTATLSSRDASRLTARSLDAQADIMQVGAMAELEDLARTASTTVARIEAEMEALKADIESSTEALAKRLLGGLGLRATTRDTIGDSSTPAGLPHREPSSTVITYNVPS